MMGQFLSPIAGNKKPHGQIRQKINRGAVCAKIAGRPASLAGHQQNMSAVRIKFTGLFRGLLRRFADDDEAGAGGNFRPSAIEPSAPIPMPPISQPPPPAATPPPAAPNPDEIQLPLQFILAALPMELRAKIVIANTGSMVISIPVERVLGQLATGSVKITFGELRQLAPGVFANSGGEHDAKMVALPLNQILAQINPSLLARRAAKKQVEISDDISSPFDARGQGLKISTEQMKASPAALRRPAEPLPMSRFNPPVSETPVAPPPVAPPPAFTPRWTMPPASEAAPRNGNGTSGNVTNGNGAPKTPFISAAPVPSASAAPVPPTTVLPGQTQPTLSAPLAALSENWPEPLKTEIELLDLNGAQVALPVHLVEPALKRGRVIFAWRDLRSWIKTAAVAVSVHDGIELELPLKVLAPLFFTRQKNGAAQKKVSVSEEIPNLFFGFPQPEPARTPPTPAPAPTPAFAPAPAHVPPTPVPSAVAAAAPLPLPDTNFFTRSIQPQTTDSEFRRKGGTDFTSRTATPSDIVFRAMELPGVAGVVIALPDGLKVASQIPADLNGDTLAAFIPQIFARVNQCSRELRMGDLNNLSFTVGNVPWKIFRVNAVYFAAFGRASEAMPSAQLAALATELDRKKQ
jgi:predicted regulator of Ras-like GTPase activity (Roadblock/LC7/MglB family)